MKCRFCSENAGFMKSYHKDCRVSAENTLKSIEEIVNEHKDDDKVSDVVKGKLKQLASSNKLYLNFMKSMAIDSTIIHINETIIYAESGLVIRESKNRCKMV